MRRSAVEVAAVPPPVTPSNPAPVKSAALMQTTAARSPVPSLWRIMAVLKSGISRSRYYPGEQWLMPG